MSHVAPDPGFESRFSRAGRQVCYEGKCSIRIYVNIGGRRPPVNCLAWSLFLIATFGTFGSVEVELKDSVIVHL